MKRLIIYDLDGTLVDTRADIAHAANYMRAQMEKPPMSVEEVSRFVGRGVHALIQGCLETDNEKEIEKGTKIYRKYYGEHMLDNSRLYPGVRDVLEYFKNRAQAVITNKPNPYSLELLKALGTADYFCEIIPGNSEHAKKPDPAAIFHLMKACKATVAETIFIGDSLVDIETGQNAGVETVVLTHGFGTRDELQSPHVSAIFESFSDLLKEAKKKGW